MPNKLMSGLLLFLAMGIASSFGQPLLPSANRWLIVVDTSLSMNVRNAATADAVQTMLLAGMRGQLQPGDTIGMWTFNETLYKGRFPLQLWRADAAKDIASRAAEFVKSQRHEKNTHYTSVMPEVDKLVANSDILTVIFLTDGDEKIQGTPFDKLINATFSKEFRIQKKARQPFIVVLRSQAGRVVQFTVTAAPWIPTFPPLPPAPEITVKTAALTNTVPVMPTPVPVPVPEVVTPSVPPLILTGKKDDSTNEPVPFTSLTATSAPVTLNPEPIAVLTPEPAPAVTQAVDVASENITPITPPPPETVAQPMPVALPDVQPPPTITPAPPTPDVSAVIEKIKAATASALEQPTSFTGIKIPAVSKKELELGDPRMAMAETQAVAAVAAMAPGAIATPVTANGGNKTRLWLGIGLVVVALGMVVLWMRKSRPAQPGSLITRSIDKDKT